MSEEHDDTEGVEPTSGPEAASDQPADREAAADQPAEPEAEAPAPRSRRRRRRKAAEPVAEEAVEPVAEEAVEPVAKEAVEPVAEEPVEPVAEEAVEPVAEDDEPPAPVADTEPDADAEPEADAEPDVDDEPEADDEPETGTAPDRPTRAIPRRRRSRLDPDAPIPVVRAHAKYVRSSARKARLVCDHIRGKSVEEARAILAVTPRAIARDWSKLLESAVANAEHNHELVGEDLYVKAVHADEGPTIKRFRPRAMGRATRIRKRTSHLTILLTPKD